VKWRSPSVTSCLMRCFNLGSDFERFDALHCLKYSTRQGAFGSDTKNACGESPLFPN